MHVNPRIAAVLATLNNPSLPGIDLSLERMWQLLAALGDPQDRLPPVIHIAGTNGKGSTLAFLRAIYEAAGYRVHAYTSPHLVRFNERIVVGGTEIEDDALLALLEQVGAAASTIPVTFFEATTAAAFLAFSQSAGDIVLLETGLGGRLDATNVVAAPMMTAITPVDYDHMEFLGHTLDAIATEKSGILKPNVPCVVGRQGGEALHAIAHIAGKVGAPLISLGKDWDYRVFDDGMSVTAVRDNWALPLPTLVGAHQHHNAAMASVIAKLGALPVSTAHLYAGLRAARWPARLQRLTQGPLVDGWGSRGAVMLDGGHNPSAAQMLRRWMDTCQEPITLMLGMMRRKDATAFMELLAGRVTRLIAVPIPGNDCYTPQELAMHAKAVGIQHAVAVDSLDDVSAAFGGGAAGTLLIAGSLFLAGELLKNHG